LSGDAWTAEIERLTLGVRALRIVHQLIHRRDVSMARLIEIKGLGADIAAVKRGIGDLRAAAAELKTERNALVAEVVDLTEQIRDYRRDLRFEAETLGNSGGSEEEKILDKASDNQEATGSADSSSSFPKTAP
jgi:hypothetical protein